MWDMEVSICWYGIKNTGAILGFPKHLKAWEFELRYVVAL
jgi:hypothetical protein